jgi:hypothetical protein
MRFSRYNHSEGDKGLKEARSEMTGWAKILRKNPARHLDGHFVISPSE